MKNFFDRTKKRALNRLKYELSRPEINVQNLKLGANVIIEPNVQIRCNRLVIGDGVIIRAGTRIEMTELIIGDYTKIHNHCYFSGTGTCQIGHNCWFGHYSIVDSTGNTTIGNGVGIGAHSQLWTHIYFGDMLHGCRFASEKPLIIEDDVWFVGHCIVSPIVARQRSMAMIGSVVTRDMEENSVYAGVPAKNVTDKLGRQFQDVSLDERRRSLELHLQEYLRLHKPKQNRIRIVDRIDPSRLYLSQYSLSERTYIKNLYKEEIGFQKYLTPTKAKFNPTPETDWVFNGIDLNI